MQIIQNRRTFLAGAAAAGSAGLFKVRPTSAAGEPAPETTTVRLGRWIGGAECWASLYLAGELLRADGLTNVRYVQGDTSVDNIEWLAGGVTDFDFNMPSMHIRTMEAGAPIKVLSGVHFGCFELRANDSINSVADLKGKRVGVWAVNDHPHVLLSLMANYVGLDPAHDIQWIQGASPMQGFMDGKVDAFLAFTTEFRKLRAEKIGHTIVSNAVDRPWSQYFCCMVAGSTDYVNKYPLATKRVLRAILKSADLCASNPTLAAQELVDRGFLPSYDDALITLQETPHDRWRDYDSEDSVRFYALRMQETGMINSSPQQIIANGTDFRFLEGLKRELKT
ncbi:MAG: ABC transporter substrate-binding protein [Mesorhizobium sp.]|uniref:ABC transporter substrate-binding protein n=1 Tax=Mesorhizobium sp. TaxID=1871066 RepID=UPI000FE6AE59|nr:ABC transporter substrate-binding protein [Mesorhizobium sp.]RWB29705.1 MAG: ABC transporter substrate-binding protein [Mesorhizobium sp.]RWC37101.1 MAG: ABC transporter substrate-binding protein [Mesorhizobium sp.]RWD21666.1 MAG: ABC transporter substrate-binding protein [Mesorhizobium sp.]